eukprot:146010_1
MPLWFGDDFLICLLGCYCWSLLETVGINITIWTFMFIDEPEFIVGLWLFCSIASITKWCILFGLFCSASNEIEKISKERADLDDLIENKNYQDAMELIMFTNSNISSAAKEFYHGHSLLQIADKCDTHIFNVVFENMDSDCFKEHYKNALMMAVPVKVKKSESVKRIVNVINVIDAPKYDFIYSAKDYENFIFCLFYFDMLVCGGELRGYGAIKNKHVSVMAGLIKNILGEETMATFDEYILKTFKCFL